MNGRLYDPVLHRFLQPDNYVQDPSNSQNYNRYAYCYNNPFKYTDPSGEIVWFIVAGAVIGGYIGGAVTSGTWNIFSGKYWQDGWKGFIGGAMIGAIAGTGVGMAVFGKAGAAAAGKTSAWFVKALTVNLKQNLIAGSVNMLSSFDKNANGFENFASFGAGFFGANFGNADNVLGSMLGSGALNVGVDAPSNLYEAGQSFISGALSGLAGVQYGTGWAKKGGAGYKFVKEPWRKGLFYAAQGMGGDFASTKQKDYLNRNVGDFAMIFGSSYLNGVLNKVDKNFPFMDKITRAVGGYFTEYIFSVSINGYNPYNYGQKGWLKAGKFSLKAGLTHW